MNQKELSHLIAAARGETPADLILANARIVNTLTAEIEMGNVAICEGRIAGIGDYHRAKEVIDLHGKYLAPGLIDGHTHIESSLLDLPQYARAVVPRGTTTIVTDLHEIANVSGLRGIRYFRDCAQQLPLEVFLMFPSCVPATTLETSGAQLTADSLPAVLNWDRVLGLGEMMNFPGVLMGNPEVLLKISLARNKIVDGHAPGLRGKELNGYLAAGVSSDHECTTPEEGREKLKRGMYLMIREGSSEKNLETLLPLVTDKTYPRCLFVVDDRTCVDLLQEGDLDAVVRKAINMGLDPIRALQLATINPARYFHLDRLGAVAPGYLADLIVIQDIEDLSIVNVFYHGQMVSEEGKPLFSVPASPEDTLRHSVNIRPLSPEALKVPAQKWAFPVIEIIPGQIITRKSLEKPRMAEGLVVSDTQRDILKLVVVERHKATGNIGLGMVKGFGLKRGALATSIAHDSHNIVAVGVEDRDIFASIREIEKLQGGLVVAGEGQVLGSLPLPIAGLLSDQPLEAVVSKLARLEKLAATLGCDLSSPFASLSFLALPVIPELRLTDKGLVDVTTFRLLQ